ncbi:MAG: hypothetical protein Kow0069_22210 [Promethearchaeota archaeon]
MGFGQMGKKLRFCCGSCLGCCCLLPMAFVASLFTDVVAAVTGGLLVNVDEFLTSLGSALPGPLAALGPLLTGLIGFILVMMFPLDWVLTYRPGNVGFAFAVIMPWILTATVTALIFAKHAKEGFIIPFLTAIYAIVLVTGSAMALTNLAGGGGALGGILDTLFSGLTDRSFTLSVATACLEGGGIGALFGALMGAIKYNPEEYNAED